MVKRVSESVVDAIYNNRSDGEEERATRVIGADRRFILLLQSFLLGSEVPERAKGLQREGGLERVW